MKLETKFSIQDKVFGIQQCYDRELHRAKQWIVLELTIGQVRVVHTDSPGIGGEKTFDNYMPQSDYKEEYMCVETGIGTGQVWGVDTLFCTREEAQAECDKRNGNG